MKQVVLKKNELENRDMSYKCYFLQFLDFRDSEDQNRVLLKSRSSPQTKGCRLRT